MKRPRAVSLGEDLGEELDNIFSGLTEDKQLEVSPSTMAKIKGDEAVEAAPKAAPKAAAPEPVKEVVKEAPKEVAAKAASAAAAGTKEPAKFKEVKEFGRLSSKPTTIKPGSETAAR